MSLFILSISAVKTKYDNYKIAADTVATDQAAVDAQKASKPTPPVDVVTNSDWNTYNAALDGWTTSLASLEATLFSSQQALRLAEIDVIKELGYQQNADYPCLDQWVKIVGTGGGPLTYTDYIGASITSTYLTILTSAPTQHYPNH